MGDKLQDSTEQILCWTNGLGLSFNYVTSTDLSKKKTEYIEVLLSKFKQNHRILQNFRGIGQNHPIPKETGEDPFPFMQLFTNKSRAISAALKPKSCISNWHLIIKIITQAKFSL